MATGVKDSVLATRLSDEGVRLTRQRRILLDVIEAASEHLHASDLLRLAREQDSRIDRATVYRTLSLLKQHGIVEELDLLHLDGSEHHYELKKGRSHVHIGCTRCGIIVELKSALVAQLEREIQNQTRCQVGSMRIEVSALCPQCRVEN